VCVFWGVVHFSFPAGSVFQFTTAVATNVRFSTCFPDNVASDTQLALYDNTMESPLLVADDGPECSDNNAYAVLTAQLEAVCLLGGGGVSLAFFFPLLSLLIILTLTLTLTESMSLLTE
jgi:hypothetical protein